MPTFFSDLYDPELAALLQRGAVGVLPTDTVYGLVAAANNPDAVARLNRIKSRDNKRGTTIAANIEQLIALGLPEDLLRRAAYLWPNPVSVAVKHDLAYIHKGMGESAFRVVKDSPLKDLLLKTGPLVTTSANAPEESTAGNIAGAERYFGDRVDFYVDGSELSDRPPSTVVGVSDNGITVFREGAVKLNEKGEII